MSQDRQSRDEIHRRLEQLKMDLKVYEEPSGEEQ